VSYYAPPRWCPTSPPLKFIQPTANEILYVDDRYGNTWNGGAQTVKVEFSKDNGVSWLTLTNSTPNTGAYYWYVTFDSTKQGRLRISNAGNAVQSATSAPFTMTQRPRPVGVPEPPPKPQ